MGMVISGFFVVYFFYHILKAYSWPNILCLSFSPFSKFSAFNLSSIHTMCFHTIVEFDLRFCTRRTNANPSSTFKFIIKNQIYYLLMEYIPHSQYLLHIHLNGQHQGQQQEQDQLLFRSLHINLQLRHLPQTLSCKLKCQ